MIKPDYIKDLEKVDGVYSETRLYLPLEDVSKLESNKNLETVYSENIFSEVEGFYSVSKIYRTTGGFYIYWKKILSQYLVCVYHKPEKSKEILIFLLSLNKK